VGSELRISWGKQKMLKKVIKERGKPKRTRKTPKRRGGGMERWSSTPSKGGKSKKEGKPKLEWMEISQPEELQNEIKKAGTDPKFITQRRTKKKNQRDVENEPKTWQG